MIGKPASLVDAKKVESVVSSLTSPAFPAPGNPSVKPRWTLRRWRCIAGVIVSSLLATPAGGRFVSEVRMSESHFLTYDQWITALCLWREARSHPEAYRAVKHVIINRANKDPRTPIPWHRVVLRRLQFSAFNADDPNAVRLPVDDGSPDWKAWLEAQKVVRENTVDPTGGATHYHTYLREDQFPKWARGVTPTTVIGPFKFYRVP